MIDRTGKYGPDFATNPLSPGESRSLYDLGMLKGVDSFANPEIRFRLVFLALASAAFAATLGQAVFLVWYLAYGAALGLHLLTVRAAPQFAPRGWVLRLRATSGLVALVYIWLGVYLWTRPETLLQHLSILLLLAGMLNTLSRRAREPILLQSDMVAAATGILARIVWLWFAPPILPATILLTVALLMTYGYYVVSCLDVARTQRALDAAHHQALSYEKYDAIGRLTAGFARDFNNMLQAVLGHAELSRLAEVPAEREAHLAEAEAAAQRGAHLTSRLLDLSQKATHAPERIEIARFRDDLEQVADRLVSPEHTVQWEAEPDLPPIRADRARLLRAVENVLCNAIEASPGPGTIRIALRRGAPGMLLVEIADSGRGIEDDMLHLVFEPYFTTKPVGRGTGLGLPEARGIIEQTGGSIRLSSVPGAGTVVIVEVPFA